MASPLLTRLRVPTKTKITKEPKTTKATKKVRATTSRPASLKAQTERTIAEIQTHLRAAEVTYYDIGRALLSLRKPEIWQLYAETSFKGFLNEHVIPYSTALRMITVAESYTKPIALEIGQERGFQLARLTRHDRKYAKKKPADLWTRNAKLGKKRVKAMTGAEIAELVKLAIMRSKPKQKPPTASEEEQEVYEELIESWEERLGHAADFDLDLKKGVIRIEVELAELLRES